MLPNRPKVSLKCNKPPTINDVARLARVSKKTVSRVINNSAFLKEETRQKILSIMHELRYVPNRQARGLALGRSFLIALVYDNPNAQYVIDLQHGILDAVRGSGLELIVHPCSRSVPSMRADIGHLVERQKLSGIVLPPPLSEDDKLCRILAAMQCPYSRIASVALDHPEHMVVTNDAEGAADAARHLAALGHRRVAFISGPEFFRSSHERAAGFRSGLKETGVELKQKYMRVGGYDFDSGLAWGRALLALRPRPTAIFAGNDEMAAGVYRAAHELNVAVPDLLSVLGFDDSPIASKMWPPLSTVRLPVREMGRIAAGRILSQAGIGEIGAMEFPQVHPALVVRQSTARAPR